CTVKRNVGPGGTGSKSSSATGLLLSFLGCAPVPCRHSTFRRHPSERRPEGKASVAPHARAVFIDTQLDLLVTAERARLQLHGRHLGPFVCGARRARTSARKSARAHTVWSPLQSSAFSCSGVLS